MEWAKKIERKWGTKLWKGRKLGGRGDGGRWYRGRSCVEGNQFKPALQQESPNSINPNFLNYPNFAKPQPQIQPIRRWKGPGQAADGAAGRWWKGGETNGGGRYRFDLALEPKSPNFAANPNPKFGPNFDRNPNWNPNPTSNQNPAPNNHRRTVQEANQGSPVRRLTSRKVQECRKLGLCFQCEGKWSGNHSCSRREWGVLKGAVVEDEEALEMEEEAVDGGDQEDEELVNTSLSSVDGVANPKTIKWVERMGNKGEDKEQVIEEEKGRGKKEDMESKGSGYSLVITTRGKCSEKLTKKSDYEGRDSILCCGASGGPSETKKGGSKGTHEGNKQFKEWANRVIQAQLCDYSFPHLVTQALLFPGPETMNTSHSYYYQNHLDQVKETTASEAKRLKAYSDAHLEDKVKLLAAGIVIHAMREAQTQLNDAGDPTQYSQE